jgi:hypothetical protein
MLLRLWRLLLQQQQLSPQLLLQLALRLQALLLLVHQLLCLPLQEVRQQLQA